MNMLAIAASENGEGGCKGLGRVKLLELVPEDGAASGVYTRAVEDLSLSLARNNAAIIEVNGEDAALVRCALDSAKLSFRSRKASTNQWNPSDWLKLSGYLAAPTKDMYYYRAGRTPEGAALEPPPPCMPEVFRCLGKTARASLSAIAHYLRLRGDAFGKLLDDLPLLRGEISSSVLTATAFHAAGSGETAILGDSGAQEEVEKGLLLLLASDTPGLQVMDVNGRWCLADNAMGPGDLLLITGKTLEQATAGSRRAGVFRVVPGSSTAAASVSGRSRTTLAFRLMPRMSATIDCTAIAEAGHALPKGYGPILVQTFLDNLAAAEQARGNGLDSNLEAANKNGAHTLRSCLLDPLSGEFLEDAMASPCGHSYGGGSLQRVYATMLCEACGVGVAGNSLIENLALRAAAAAFKLKEQNKQTDIGSLRVTKRKREWGAVVEYTRMKKPEKESPPSPEKDASPQPGSQSKTQILNPFTADERVLIMGNKRTPEKLVGREASIISQCLNGWYLVRLLDSGENVRLQYRSLARTSGDQQVVNEGALVVPKQES